MTTDAGYKTKLQEARRQCGLTIHALAEAASVNPAQVCVLDNGARVKSKLSIYLGMTPAELFPEGPEDPPA